MYGSQQGLAVGLNKWVSECATSALTTRRGIYDIARDMFGPAGGIKLRLDTSSIFCARSN
jgi:hypothetical protein